MLLRMFDINNIIDNADDENDDDGHDDEDYDNDGDYVQIKLFIQEAWKKFQQS